MRSNDRENPPRSVVEMVGRYDSVVRQLVERNVCFGISHEDAVSEIWVKVLQTEVLTKFRRARRERLRLSFRAYFYVTVLNHLKNLFRSLERRSNSETPSLCDHNAFSFECEWCRRPEADARACSLALNAEVHSQAFRYRMTREHFRARVTRV